jgi:hypothetical protein
MRKVLAFIVACGLVPLASGCGGDADRPGDESGESPSGGNVSQAMHDATGTGDPVHEDDETAGTGALQAGGTAPSGAGDNSEAAGSGVEAVGGGATGVRESGAARTGTEGGAGGAGTDPGDS